EACGVMAELRHFAQVGEADAMIRGPQQFGEVSRTRKALRAQFIKERKPDVRSCKHALLARRGPFQTPLHQFCCEGWARCECVCSCAYAASHDALNREVARITAQREVHRPSNAWKPIRKSFHAIQVDRR